MEANGPACCVLKLTAMVLLVPALFGVIEEGEKEQLTVAGAPVQAKLMVPL